jgi:hypothetical protein
MAVRESPHLFVAGPNVLRPVGAAEGSAGRVTGAAAGPDRDSGPSRES